MTNKEAVGLVAQELVAKTSNYIGFTHEISKRGLKLIAENEGVRESANLNIDGGLGLEDNAEGYYISYPSKWASAEQVNTLMAVLGVLADIGRALEAAGIPASNK